MYDRYYSNNTVFAPRAQEVALRAREQEKKMALLRLQYNEEFAPFPGRSINFFTGIVYALLSVIGLK